MNFTSIKKIRIRLINIIDQILSEYDEEVQNMRYGLDQSKLENLYELIKISIVEKQEIVEIVSVKKSQDKGGKGKKMGLPKIYGNKVEHLQEQHQDNIKNKNQITPFRCNKLLQILNDSKLIVHQLPLSVDKFHPTSKKGEYQFKKGSLKQHSSLVQISQNIFIISGGITYQDPFQKSQDIYQLQLQMPQLKKIGKLLQPLSSHACVYIQPRVYFVGGKMNYGVATKRCSYFDVRMNSVREIAQLNYVVASCCVIGWKQKYIYKIGGVGQCFQKFSISPYIERYRIDEDYWQVINPYIPQDVLNNFNQFQLYAHSLAYITYKDQLVILGGFDINKKGTNFGCVIEISQNEVGEEEGREMEGGDEENSKICQEQIYQIKKFGSVEELEEGGFWTSQFIVQENGQGVGRQSIYALLTTINPLLTTKFIRLSTN